MGIDIHLKAGIAQIDSRVGDLAHNMQVHLQLIAEAGNAGVELLLFPELSLTGYGLGNAVPDIALERDSPAVLKLAQAAGGMTVVFGFVEEAPAAQFYNAAAVIKNGQLVHVHRKVNLPSYGRLEEGKLFAAGQRVETFDVARPWTAGLLTCADLWNPALVHLSMVQGATLLLAPVNSAVGAVSDEFSNPRGWDLATRFYAMMYGAPILMANRIGSEGPVRFWGGSRIVDPFGEILAQSADDSPCLLTAELNYSHVRNARFQLPTLRDSNLPLVHREMSRLMAQHNLPDIGERP
ncbi:MAG: nitrilase [Polaromonas sp.]|nr:nitrilase [Polaromonas sp.]